MIYAVVRVVRDGLYSSLPWLVEEVNTGRPIALCWLKEEADKIELALNGPPASEPERP